MIALEESDLQHQINVLAEGCHDLEWQEFPVRLIKQPWGELLISFQGAQVLHFRPANERPVLWLTTQPKRAPGAIRGGVPLCWPWFADHPEDTSLPAHGVARTACWRLESEQLNESGGRWVMAPVESIWPDLILRLEIVVAGGELKIVMTTENAGQQAVSLTQALHSYLAISARDRIEIEGLAGCSYLDKLQAMAQFELNEPFAVTQETDRIFAHENDVLLVDHGWRRALRIAKRCSASTVVWNPGKSATQMADIGLEQVDRFVCIEAARTEPFDEKLLAAGESVSLETRFVVEEYPGEH